jgi:ParB family chromosome partitioning protein
MPSIKLRDLAESVGEFLTFRPDLIDVDPGFNVRMETPDYLESIQETANSIRALGFLREKPLIVRRVGDRVTIIDGHGRFRACQMAIAEGAEIKAIPCIVVDRNTTEEERTLALITTNNGRPLLPLEQAVVVKRLLSYGWKQADIAAKIGKPISWLNGLLTLSGADREVREMVANGNVSATEALRVIKKDGAKAGATLKRAAASVPAGKKVTARSVEAARPPEERKPGLKAAVLTLLEEWDNRQSLQRTVSNVAPDFIEFIDALRMAR